MTENLIFYNNNDNIFLTIKLILCTQKLKSNLHHSLRQVFHHCTHTPSYI